MTTINQQAPLAIELEQHEYARQSLLELQNKTGAAIKPFGLFELFYEWLKAHYPSKMNKVRARNLSDVLSALLNEWYCINHNRRSAVIWFYMTEKRWAKYGLGRKAITNSINLLAEIGMIEYRVSVHPHIPQNLIRFFKVDPEFINGLTGVANRRRFNQNSR